MHACMHCMYCMHAGLFVTSFDATAGAAAAVASTALGEPKKGLLICFAMRDI